MNEKNYLGKISETESSDEDEMDSSDEQNKIDKYIKEFIDSELEYDTVSSNNTIHENYMENLCIKYLINNSDIHINELIDFDGKFIVHYKLKQHLKAKKIHWKCIDWRDFYFINVVLKKKKH